MTIDFEQEGAADLGLDLYEIAEEVISCALDYMGCPYEAQVGLLITDNEEIHRINKEQRGIDSATDVLSFPMTQYEVPGDFDFLEDEGIDCFEPDTGELMLGDIVISADKVHLIGYDHMTPEEAAQMEALQEEILEKLNITR